MNSVLEQRSHEGLALFTTDDVFHGRVATVHINPDLAIPAQQLIDAPGSLRCVPTPVDTSLPEVVT